MTNLEKRMDDYLCKEVERLRENNSRLVALLYILKSPEHFPSQSELEMINSEIERNHGLENSRS